MTIYKNPAEKKAKPALSLEAEAESLRSSLISDFHSQARACLQIILSRMEGSPPALKSEIAAILKLLHPPASVARDVRKTEEDSTNSFEALQEISTFVKYNKMTSETVSALRSLVESAVRPYGTATFNANLAVNVPLKSDMRQAIRAIQLLDTVIRGSEYPVDLPLEGDPRKAAFKARIVGAIQRHRVFKPEYLTPEFVSRLKLLSQYEEGTMNSKILPYLRSDNFNFSAEHLDAILHELRTLGVTPQKSEP